MTRKRIATSWLLAACCLAFFAGDGDGRDAQTAKTDGDLAVVVNPQNSLNDVKLTMLKKLVLGEQTFWSNRLSVVLVLKETGTPEREAVLRAIAQMNESQFHQHWVAKVFRGEAPSEPLTLQSTDMVVAFVTKNPGAVAFLPRSDVPSDLKIVTIDGMKPGDDGYPVR